MSDTYIIPSLYNGDQLSPSGEALVKYIEKRIRELRAANDLEKMGGDALVNYYALVMKSPQLKAPVQWVKDNYDKYPLNSLWLRYLQSLEPVDAERAQHPTPVTPTQPTEGTRTVNEGTKTTLLIEDSNYWSAVQQYGHDLPAIEAIKRARATGQPLTLQGDKVVIEEAPQVEQLTITELARFVKTPDDFKVLERAARTGELIIRHNGALILESQYRAYAAIMERVIKR
jgi:hypothetical protein